MPIFTGMPVYKNKPEKQPLINVIQDFDTHTARESRIQMDAHTGTHVDAPLHMVEGGSTLESITLEQLVGPCRVADLTHVEEGIGREHLESLELQAGERVLFKTRNSLSTEFDPGFVYLNADGAAYVCERGVALVGIDALGIERSQPEHETHKQLFAQGVVIIEGLRLQEVPAGSYLLIAAPLKLLGTEAAPARVLLLEGV